MLVVVDGEQAWVRNGCWHHNRVVTDYVISIFPRFRGRPRPLYIGTMTFTKALSPALREIRILCSQTGPASAGTRSANECTTVGHLLKSLVPQTIHPLEIPSYQEA